MNSDTPSTPSPKEPAPSPVEGIQRNDNAFITGVNVEGKLNLNHRDVNCKVIQSVPIAGSRVVQYFYGLCDLIEELPSKLESLVKEHESECFLAYKTHMYKISGEFEALRAKAEEQDIKTKRDNQIQELEKELEWFMTEALRLDELCKAYKREALMWKTKGNALREDRKFLQEQVRLAQASNMSLADALTRAHSQSTNALSSTSTVISDKIDERNKMSYAEKKTLSIGGTSSLVEEKKKELKKLKSDLSNLRTSEVQEIKRSSELEELFLSCVSEGRKEVFSRKSVAKRRTSEDNNDNILVIDRLVSSEEVLVFLFESLFPHRSGKPIKNLK